MLLSHQALPREGHLAQTLHTFAYLDKLHDAEMIFNSTEWNIPPGEFKKQDWTNSIYSCEGFQEEMPNDIPKSLSESMHLSVFVDSDHAGDQVTRRSRTVLLYFSTLLPSSGSGKSKAHARPVHMEVSSLR